MSSKKLAPTIQKDLVDPRVHILQIPKHIQATLKNKENAANDLLQTYKDEIARLKEELAEAEKTTNSMGGYKNFHDYLSTICPQTGTRLTIVRCTQRVRKGECLVSNCSARNNILKKLETKRQ